MSLSYDEIAEILKLIDNSSCDELIVETADMKLVVRRNGASPTSAAKAEYTTRPPAACCYASVSCSRGAQRPAQGRSGCGPNRGCGSDGRHFLSGAESGMRRLLSKSAPSFAKVSRFV